MSRAVKQGKFAHAHAVLTEDQFKRQVKMPVWVTVRSFNCQKANSNLSIILLKKTKKVKWKESEIVAY